MFAKLHLNDRGIVNKAVKDGQDKNLCPVKKSTTFKLFELKKGMYPKPPNEKAIILIAIQARV